jgi:hypothetical protein
VRDQGFLFGEFQFEVISQKVSDLSLDLFGFASWSDESQEEVVSVSDISQSSEVGIIQELGRQLPLGFPKEPCFF